MKRRKLLAISIADYSASRLFIISPTPRTEVGEGAGINISCEAENASSVAFEYLNTSGSWVSIGSGTNSSGDTWTYSSWSPTVNALAIKAIATYPGGSTQECVNNLYSYSINDTFTDTNGTAIGSHTPDDNLGANGWATALGGNWEIQSNALEINSTAGTNYEITHDAQTYNAIFSFKITSFTTTNAMQKLIRWVDANEFLMMFLRVDGSYDILEKTPPAGSSTAILSVGAGAVSAGDEIEIWAIDDLLQVVVNGAVSGTVVTDSAQRGTKFGFRRSGQNDTPTIDNVQIIPVHSPVIDSSVSYTVTKHGSIVFANNQVGASVDDLIMSPSFYLIGTTMHMVYATKTNGGVWGGLLYATSDTSDIHNWTIQNSSNYILTAGSESIADCAIEYDGSTWHVIYSDRFTGILKYASGSSLTSLTKQGTIKDLTGSGLYIRQSDMFLENGTWYVYSDIRTDQVAGEHGYIGVMTGSSLTTLGSPTEVLSTPGYDYDMLNLTQPYIHKQGSYYELAYLGYYGRNITSSYSHSNGMAISKNPTGKFARIASTDFIPEGGGGSIDENGAGTARRLPGTSIVYYGATGGFTYATLS